MRDKILAADYVRVAKTRSVSRFKEQLVFFHFRRLTGDTWTRSITIPQAAAGSRVDDPDATVTTDDVLECAADLSWPAVQTW